MSECEGAAEPPQDQHMDPAHGVLWPLTTGPNNTRRAVAAAELYAHFVLFVMRAADAGHTAAPAGEPAFPAATVALAQRLYEAIEARLEELGVPSRQRVRCGRCGGRAYTPFPADETLETWAACTAEMDPEQFLRQGACTPTDLLAINTMAGGGSGGGGRSTYNYALAPELTQTAYAAPSMRRDRPHRRRSRASATGCWRAFRRTPGRRSRCSAAPALASPERPARRYGHAPRRGGARAEQSAHRGDRLQRDPPAGVGRWAARGARRQDRHRGAPLARHYPPGRQQVRLNQVVNLITNAHQAMHGVESARRLTIRTRTEALGPRVRLEVADTGPGIPDEVLTRIFEPFFTTKPVGQGTGLGLPLCQDIVEGHGGTIRVDSKPGQGATFLIEPPVVPAPPGQAGDASGSIRTLPPGRRILIVDDEPDVAGVLGDLLRADGEEIEAVADGRAALEKIQAGDYDLILCDVRMPRLDGPGLYRALDQSNRKLLPRFVFLTGDTLNPESWEFVQRTGAPCINKPFDFDEVKRVIGRALLRDR